MGWLGKVVGGTIGFAIGGPLGAVAGGVFGHAFDLNNQVETYDDREVLSSGEGEQFTFFIAAFSMLAKLVKVDGLISKEEIQSIEKFMVHELNLSVESRKVAMNIFYAASRSSQTFSDFALQFYSKFKHQPQILEVMLDILLRVSVADSALNDSEEKLILEAARIFNMNEKDYSKLKLKYIKEANRYYAILGCGRDDSFEIIKKQYRKLASEYHPDKIASKGLPEEFNKFAHDKFREINEAYELVKKERGIK